MNNTEIVILKRQQVEKITGLSRSSIYQKVLEGTFPKAIRLGTRSVGWLEHEVYSWLQERIDERDNGAA